MIDLYTKAKITALLENCKVNYKVCRFKERKEAQVWRIVYETLTGIIANQETIDPDTGKILER